MVSFASGGKCVDVKLLAVWNRDVILPLWCNYGDIRGLGGDGLYYDVKFIKDCLNNPVGVSDTFGGEINPDVMFAISVQMIAQYRLIVAILAKIYLV